MQGKEDMKENLRKQWTEACLSVGLPALTLATSAKIMAVLLHFGNNEAMTHSPHFMADCEYIQKRYGLQGGETPDPDFATELRHYSSILEHADTPPEWAKRLFKGMYNINI